MFEVKILFIFDRKLPIQSELFSCLSFKGTFEHTANEKRRTCTSLLYLVVVRKLSTIL